MKYCLNCGKTLRKHDFCEECRKYMYINSKGEIEGKQEWVFRSANLIPLGEFRGTRYWRQTKKYNWLWITKPGIGTFLCGNVTQEVIDLREDKAPDELIEKLKAIAEGETK